MKTILLKLSGEALFTEDRSGFNDEAIKGIAVQVRTLMDQGCRVAIVTGGGNFWRGKSNLNIDRSKTDQIGMLATVMNCIYVSEVFRTEDVYSVVMTPFDMGTVAELYSKDKVRKAFEEGKVIFFAGGTGHPYFTTDTTTVLRALEIGADEVLLAKSIDGVYSADPKSDPNAVKYDTLTMQEVVDKGLKVIDLTASTMALENSLPLCVFALNEENSIIRAASGEKIGTRITIG